MLVLCLSWGFNQVAVKLAIHDIPPLMQAAIRSVGAALIVAAWCKARGIPLLSRDGTLLAGLAAGAALRHRIHFDLSRPALHDRRRARCCSSILAPFFVVLGARCFCPPTASTGRNGLGLALSFAGMRSRSACRRRPPIRAR